MRAGIKTAATWLFDRAVRNAPPAGVCDALRALDARLVRHKFAPFAHKNGSRYLWHEGNSEATHVLESMLSEPPFQLLPLEDREFRAGSRRFRNVIARLPGEEESAIVIGAHLDSTAIEDNRFILSNRRGPAPGADDDGSGLAAVLSIAHVFGELRKAGAFRRSLLFALFNAEEAGLAGSRHFASRPETQRTTTAMIQIDTVGYHPSAQRATWEIQTGDISSQARGGSEQLAQVLQYVHLLVSPNLAPARVVRETPAYANSDHRSFQEVGVPACLVTEDGRARNPHQHLCDDTTDHLNFTCIADIARVVAAAAWVLTNV